MWLAVCRLTLSDGGSKMTFQCLEDEASLVAQLVKNQPAMQGVRSLSSIPESGRSPGEGKGYPLQYSGLEDSVDYIVYGVPESWT